MVTINSYFSGAGLFDLGLQQGGLNIGRAYELDTQAVKTYRANFTDHQMVHTDLTKELVFDEPECDGMAITFPCTKYSNAANINSSATGDELYLHALRHIALAQPEFYLIENVTNLRMYPVVMEALTRLPDYYVQMFCPVRSEFWLPQKRNRVIIVGTKRHFPLRPPEHVKPIPLKDILEKEPDVGTIPKSVYERMNGKYRDLPIISDAAKGDISPCVVSHYAKDRSTRLVVDRRYPMGVRPYTVRELARLQGLPDDFHFPVSNTSAMKQIGNGVSVPVGRWLGNEMVRYMNYNYNKFAAA